MVFTVVIDASSTKSYRMAYQLLLYLYNNWKYVLRQRCVCLNKCTKSNVCVFTYAHNTIITIKLIVWETYISDWITLVQGYVEINYVYRLN